MMDSKYLIPLLLIILNFQISSAIICFYCNSMENAKCGDDFRVTTSDSTSRFYCDGSCVKRRGERVSGSVRRIEIVRSCITRRQEGCYNENYNSLDMYTCSCNGEFCNSSSRLSLSAKTVTLMGLFSILLCFVVNM